MVIAKKNNTANGSAEGQGLLLRRFDAVEYFSLESDDRRPRFEKFNFDIFAEPWDLFTDDECNELEQLNQDYLQRKSKLSSTIIKKEIERLTIELSWKSSRLEGNTYSLLDAEVLIRENKAAAGKDQQETVMILNHKKVLDYIWSEPQNFYEIDLRKIQDLHRLIVAGLGIDSDLRRRPVGIVGTRFTPIDNEHQILEAMEKSIKAINRAKKPLVKALLANLLIAYVQPFEDGNKRTARILGNALLLAHDFCPLSFRSINEADYKKAVILFYEQNSAAFFKQLFVEQFRFSVGNYFK